ncbi:MAG TPA: nuclear transport factor 2 family protein [Sphingomicrobium sp.]|nr:nuclear transport factor 2 family protein [Sphingomicrobium sp.]
MTDKSANDFDNILSASERWMRAWQDQNRNALEQLLAPDFALVVSTAPHYHFSRKDWIDLATGSYICTRFAYEHVQFHRISSDIVVMSAVANQDASLGLEDRSGRFFVTDIWRRMGRWKVCARYSTPPSEVDRTVTYMVGAAERE